MRRITAGQSIKKTKKEEKIDAFVFLEFLFVKKKKNIFFFFPLKFYSLYSTQSKTKINDFLSEFYERMQSFEWSSIR